MTGHPLSPNENTNRTGKCKQTTLEANSTPPLASPEPPRTASDVCSAMQSFVQTLIQSPLDLVRVMPCAAPCEAVVLETMETLPPS